MSESLKENATHITNLKGKITEKTVSPSDSGVAGLKVGRVWYRSDHNHLVVRTSTSLNKSVRMTTTSTTTS